MLVVATIAKIRRMCLVEGRSIRSVARDLGLARNTVRKFPKLPSVSTRHLAPSRQSPKEKDYRERKAGKGGSVLDAY